MVDFWAARCLGAILLSRLTIRPHITSMLCPCKRRSARAVNKFVTTNSASVHYRDTDWRGLGCGKSALDRGEKERSEMVCNPSIFHKTAKSTISRPSNFNELRRGWRNENVSQAKFSDSQAKESFRT